MFLPLFLFSYLSLISLVFSDFLSFPFLSFALPSFRFFSFPMLPRLFLPSIPAYIALSFYPPLHPTFYFPFFFPSAFLSFHFPAFHLLMLPSFLASPLLLLFLSSSFIPSLSVLLSCPFPSPFPSLPFPLLGCILITSLPPRGTRNIDSSALINGGGTHLEGLARLVFSPMV